MSLEMIETLGDELSESNVKLSDFIKTTWEKSRDKLYSIKDLNQCVRETMNYLINKLKSYREDYDELAKNLDKKNLLIMDQDEQCELEISKLVKLKKDLALEHKLCNELNKYQEPSKKDKQTIEKINHKFHVYKDFSNIVWDYSESNLIVSGYVRNKPLEYIHPFEFKRKEDPQEKIVEKCWREVALSSNENWDDIVRMDDAIETAVKDFD